MKGGRALSRSRGRGRSSSKVRSRGALQGASRFSTPVHPLLQLQQTIGNQSVSRLIQAKLKHSHSGDGLGPTSNPQPKHSAIQDGQQKSSPAIEDVPHLKGKGSSYHATAYLKNASVRLEGRTDATFDGGFRTENVVTQAGTDCANCQGKNCVHVRGTLVATYTVSIQVTLPQVSDFPNLTPCQVQRVRDAIRTVLAPHEQEHVRAFKTYNGTTRRNFDLALCRSEFSSTIQSIFETEERARRSAAQAVSDQLDPFHFDVDLNCEDSPNAKSQEKKSAKPTLLEESTT